MSYACRRCEQAGHAPQFARPDLPPEPIPQGSAAAGLVAHVLVSKYVDHLPLHRQEAILDRLGLGVSRTTLCDWVLRAADVLGPVYRGLVDRVKQSYAIHADDTPVTLLRPRRQAYAWVVVGDRDHPFTVFDLTPSRSQQCPAQFLAGYAGFVHADAYAGYHPVHAGARHVGCWMHARRGFADARDRDPRAADALAHIRTLYAIEARAKELGLGDAALSQYRRDHARPILDRLADWLADQARTALPAGAFGQAVGYARNQWASLIRYVDDGRLRIDNGPAEQAIRPLAVGRRNWLFVGGDRGLRAAAVHLSVTASARAAGLNPWAYLRDVLTRLSARPPDADVSDLLPDRWSPAG